MSNFKITPDDKGDTEDFDALLDQSEKKSGSFSVGDRVTARVVRTGRDYLFLDVGARTEGLLSREETKDREALPEVGEQLEVFVTAFRDGAVICGRTVTAGRTDARTSDKEAIQNALREAYDARMPVEGTVKESIKGGFSINLMGERAFCPISQIDTTYCETPEVHLGRVYPFEIIKLEEGGRNIVVSRRRVLEREAKELAAKTWREIEVGGTYKGTVTTIKPYGAFVDIGGVQGLLHVSELGYDQVDDPGEVLTQGQEITVSVKDMDLGKGRISLSLKALMDDPWNSALDIIRPNAILEGKVRRIANFGAFVELKPGIDGLVHISNMAKDRRLKSPKEVVSEGEEVTVRVLDVNPDTKRIGLTMILEEEKEEDWKEALDEVKQAGNGTGMGTLGDLLSEKLSQ
jgi:small subunit ribosomal protein S1